LQIGLRALLNKIPELRLSHNTSDMKRFSFVTTRLLVSRWYSAFVLAHSLPLDEAYD
jgi:hypothetical protein